MNAALCQNSHHMTLCNPKVEVTLHYTTCVCVRPTDCSINSGMRGASQTLSLALKPSMIDTTMPRDCQSKRPRKAYTYLHLTAAHLHGQPPGLPLLQSPCMPLDLRIASEVQSARVNTFCEPVDMNHQS